MESAIKNPLSIHPDGVGFVSGGGGPGGFGTVTAVFTDNIVGWGGTAFPQEAAKNI
jgi:hypothetical protein